MSEFVPCRIACLPEWELIPAARTAIRIQPANRPPAAELPPLAALESMPGPSRLALLTSRWWGAAGVRLTVGFLDGPPADLRARVVRHMNAWSASANVAFTETNQADAAVRIARTPGQGYYSYLGTDILHVPAGKPTLNLDSFTMNTPESEFVRVVRHETGHTLGFPHEHLRRQIVARLDPRKTINYFARTQGWSEVVVRQQVLTPLDDADLTATPDADPLSIMCYQLPGSITIDGQPVIGGSDIDEWDYELVALLYPPPTAPPPPPAGRVRVVVEVDCDTFRGAKVVP